MRQCRCNFSYQFREKNPVRPAEKCPFVVLARKTIILQHLIIHFPSIICQVVGYGRLKTNEKFQTFSSKSGRGRLREVVV